MGSAQHHLGLSAHLGGDVRFQCSQYRAGCGQLGKHGFRQTQSLQDFRVVLSGQGIHKAGGGGIGVLPRLHAAEPPQQVLRDHQKVLSFGQPPGFFVGIQLINAVEGLELDTGALIKLLKGQNAVHLIQYGVRPVIPVGVDRVEGLPIFQQHIVHRPCVDRKALDDRVLCKGFPDALLHVDEQAVDVPFQMAVHPLDAIGKTVHFLGAENTVLHPSHDVPSAGRTNVDGKIVFVHNGPPVWV